jgi:hypothetical protein
MPGIERAGVPVRSDSEQDEIEAVGELDLLRTERVDLILRNRDASEQRLPRQALVRVLVLGRDEPLVAPPDLPRGPTKLEPRKVLVDGPGRRTTGQGDSERILALRALGDPRGGVDR